MEQASRKRSGELLQRVFETLMACPEGLVVAEVLRRVGESNALTEIERSRDRYHGMSPFEETILLTAIPMIRAGWLKEEEGRWRVTPRGASVCARVRDPEAFVLEAGRESIKGWFVVHMPRTYLFICRIKVQWHIELQMVRRNGAGRILKALLGITASWQKKLPIQAPRRFHIPGLRMSCFDDLANYLDSSGLAYYNAGHTFYLPPDSARESPFGEMMRSYPDGAGLKITKTPGDANKSYLFGGVRNRRISVMYNRLTYNRRHLVLVANLLYNEGIGPRLYDLAQMECGGQVWTAYIVEHISGRMPTVPECEAGINKIRALETEGLLKVTLSEGYKDEDLRCPDCNNNAFVANTGRFLYVDFQSFNLVDYDRYLGEIATRSTGVGSAGDGLTHPRHTTVVASADDGRRIAALSRLMHGQQISVENRLVLQVGGKSEGLVAHCLKGAAGWCHAWEPKELAESSQQSLLALGCTRFSITPLGRDDSPSLDGDLPSFLKPLLDGCVLFVSADYASEPLLTTLRTIPWSLLVCELDGSPETILGGHLGSPGRTEEVAMGSVCSYQDGHGRRQDLTIFRREPRMLRSMPAGSHAAAEPALESRLGATG
jgi:hypothetical protein